MKKITLLLTIVLTFQLANGQTDSTCNFNYITQQMDAYYDSIIASSGDSSLEGSGYKEYHRWKNHMYFRQGKNGDLYDHEEYISTYMEGTRNISDDDGSDWSYFGPKGVPESHTGANNHPTSNGKGMITSIYVNPNNHNYILVGSHNSGVWKTEDRGETWYCLTDNNFKIRGVNCILVNPDDPLEILIASFNSLSNHSYGLFKSNDGGSSWNEMNNGLEIFGNSLYPSKSIRNLPRKILYRPSDSTLFYITHSYVFKSSGFDAEWELVFSMPSYPNWLFDKGFFDIEYDTQYDSILYLSGTDIFKSLDDGLSWTMINGLIIGDTLAQVPIRTEISTNENYPGKVWFNCLIYDTVHEANRTKIVRFDPQSNPIFYTYPLYSYTDAGAYAMEFEVSPNNENDFYLGDIHLYVYDALTNDFQSIAENSDGPLNPNWVHVDIRDMQIVKYGSTGYRMYLAHDGGVSWAELEGSTGSYWTWHFIPGDKEHGLDVFEFYDFTCTDELDELVLGGCQDLAGFQLKSNNWYHFGGGDGGETAIDNSSEDTTFIYYNSPGAYNAYIYRSTNLGQSLDEMYEGKQGSFFTALELSPTNSNRLYYAADTLYEFNNARYSNEYAIIPLNNHHPLSDIEQIAGGSRYISSERYYTPWDDPYSPPSQYSKCFWRGTQDLSENMLGLFMGYITDIEFNPDDPKEVWSAYGKATSGEGDTTKKIYFSDNWGQVGSWEPFVEGFPEGIPVRKLLYDHKYNRLYCASDIGVWVRDLNMENHEWVEFNNNLPFKIVIDLEILYSQGKIRAATYGRGIWESPIYCKYDAENPYTVSGTETWDEDVIMTSDIIIPDSAELNIDNCNVFMPTNAKIIVQYGGKLSLNGAHISNACDHLWMGIEVWGDPTKDQIQQEQGFVESKGGTIIENAYCAMYAGKKDANGYSIQGFGGGILQIKNTTFRNNKRAIELWPYHYTQATYFKACTFETTEKLLDNYNFEYFIAMVQYISVRLEGCTFRNTREAENVQAHYRGTGIYSMESTYILDRYMDGFEIIENSFEGLNYGIKTYNISSIATPWIRHTEFSANITGAYFSGNLRGLILTECDFNVKSYNPAYNNYIYCGLYLDNCTGYWIEENTFNNPTPPIFQRPNEVIGITVNNSGDEANEIYRNTFDGMDIGILAQNSNRDANGDLGLVIKCNDFGPNLDNLEYDIAVTAYQGWPNAGIKRDQGDDFDPSAPAGNMFSHLPDTTFSDYYNETSGIYYYQHIPNPTRLDLEDYTLLTISKEQTGWEYDEVESCESNLSKSKSEMKTAISEYKIKSDSVSFLLDALVDGGNTQELESDVALSTPPEAFTVYNDLMMKSPYLTDTVMIEAVNKEDVLNPLMVKDVLVANPQSAKSDEVMDELDSRMNPLPDYMITEIEAGKDSLSDKELMEASKSYFKHQRAINLNLLKHFYTFDTLGVGNADSLLALLQNENTLTSKYELAFEYIMRSEYSLANAELSNIPNQFVLNDEQLNRYHKYTSIMPVVTDIYQNNKSVYDLDSLQISLLDSIAQDSNCMPGIYARNMLIFAGILEHTESYLLPDSSLKAIPDIDKPAGTQSMSPRFKVYPNPAGSYIAIEYNLKQEGCSGYIILRDNLGRTVKMIPVSSSRYSMIVPTSELSNGQYFISLRCNNNFIATEKVIIQH